MYKMTYGTPAFVNTPVVSQGTTIWLTASAILAIIGAIYLVGFFLKKKNKASLKGNLVTAFNFLNFDILIIESILRFCYICSTIFVILASFTLIQVDFVAFLSTLIIMPIIIRISFEMSLLIIKLCNNVSEINEKLGKKK